MTGFARAEGRADSLGWAWEARSVNGRGLDVRLRLAPGLEALEPAVRDMVARHVARGSVSLNLTICEEMGQARLRINEAALAQVLEAALRLQQRTGCPPPRAEGLLALKGVLEMAEADAGPRAADGSSLRAAVLDGLAEVLADLTRSRRAEGTRLQTILDAQLTEVSRLVGLVEAAAARRPEAIRARLKEQIGRILETGTAFDEQRIAQEAVVIAARADVEEELKRLSAHVGAARDLIAETGAIGRKLDFLAQEFNREANTLCAKSIDVEMTRAGLALKSVIDQMREQVQNIE